MKIELKNGSKIHIKKKNRGKFTEYCGGSVTDECIRRAKSSGNPTLVKRATFAANARKWKHLTGGLIRKAEEGTKVDWTSAISNIGQSLLTAYNLNREAKANAELLKAQNLQDLTYFLKYLINQNKKDTDNIFQQWVQNYLSGLTLDNPSYDTVGRHFGNQLLNLDLAQVRQQINTENKTIDEETKLKISNALGSTFSGIFQTGLGLVGLYLANKKNNPPLTETS